MRKKTLSIFVLFLSVLISWQQGKAESIWLPLNKKDSFGYGIEIDKAFRWRCIGPYQGGRSTAVAGIPGSSQPYTYYAGYAGGGVWKTVDGGLSWKPVSDGCFKTGSVGSIAVAESDSNVIYVGMGGQWLRANVSHGDGIYKSTDAGETWEHIWKIPFSQTVKIRIHPQDPGLVYAAVFGRVYGASETRGIFRSEDGGKTWEKILFRDDKTGAIDIILDPSNPRNIYASLWEARGTPYGVESGGPGSGLFKSTDGGDTWKEISRNRGLPQGLLGKIGVTVSPANSHRVWAVIEADDGGIFRSDDGGISWMKINDDCRLKYRPWTYYRIFADPGDENTVYLVSQRFWRSVDAGRTWQEIHSMHLDNHDLWIDPENPKRMINANDGGANISIDGGVNWTPQDNQPTLQFYHVTTDDQLPYRIYGSAQDQNATVCIASRTNGPGIGKKDYYSVGGCETGHIAPHPVNPDIVFASCCGISITRWYGKGPHVRDITPWPENPVGRGADELKYRFQWVTPILISKFEPYPLYAGANVVFKTTDEGQSWNIISPDLTTNDKSKQVSAGGPLTKDNTPSFYYCTIFAMAESFHDPDILWVGSDDGLVHITKDGGKTWKNATPPQMRQWSSISAIETSAFNPGTAYLAVDPHKLDDFRPDAYKTSDYGRTWKRIVNGLPDDTFVRVIREDPKKEGLLYAGTEKGVFVSIDDGANWQSLQFNLPVVPIHDLAVKNGDLIAATHGRSFWVLDDISPLAQITEERARSDFYLFRPRDAYRIDKDKTFFGQKMPNLGDNPPDGSIIYYHLKDKPEGEVILEFSDARDNLIKKFSSQPVMNDEPPFPEAGKRQAGFAGQFIPAEKGMNRFIWNMRYPHAEKIKHSPRGAFTPSALPPQAAPGTYRVTMKADGRVMTQSWEWKCYPSVTASQKDLQQQFDFLIKIRDKISEVNGAVNIIRDLRSQIEHNKKIIEEYEANNDIAETCRSLEKKLILVENELVQPKIKCPERWIEFPAKLNALLISLSSKVQSTDARPTNQSYKVFEELSNRVDRQLEKLTNIRDNDIAALNKLMSDKGVPHIIVRTDF